jgi:hypothetical protein
MVVASLPDAVTAQWPTVVELHETAALASASAAVAVLSLLMRVHLSRARSQMS